MPLDGVGVRCLAQELNQALARGRVDRVDQPERFDLVLQLRQGQANKRLLLSANPGAPRVHLTSQPTERPQRPPRFCLLLRKHLLGARLLGVQAPDYERILVFTFECQNDLGDRVEKQLLVELMGRHSNLLFLNEHQVLHDALIQIDHSVNRVRELLPAREGERVRVLIHDGARCLLPAPLIGRVLEVMESCRCGTAPAVPVTDTIRLLDEEGSQARTLPRARLAAMQTPQGADLDVLLEAALLAREAGIRATDDLELLIRIGYPVRLVAGDRRNIKITTREDALVAESFCEAGGP